MTTPALPPPPLTRTEEGGDNRPRPPRPRTPVLLDPRCLDDLIIAATDRLPVIQDQARRDALQDAIQGLTDTLNRIGLQDLARTIRLLDGYPG